MVAVAAALRGIQFTAPAPGDTTKSPDAGCPGQPAAPPLVGRAHGPCGQRQNMSRAARRPRRRRHDELQPTPRDAGPADADADANRSRPGRPPPRAHGRRRRRVRRPLVPAASPPRRDADARAPTTTKAPAAYGRRPRAEDLAAAGAEAPAVADRPAAARRRAAAAVPRRQLRGRHARAHEAQRPHKGPAQRRRRRQAARARRAAPEGRRRRRRRPPPV